MLRQDEDETCYFICSRELEDFHLFLTFFFWITCLLLFRLLSIYNQQVTTIFSDILKQISLEMFPFLELAYKWKFPAIFVWCWKPSIDWSIDVRKIRSITAFFKSNLEKILTRHCPKIVPKILFFFLLLRFEDSSETYHNRRIEKDWHKKHDLLFLRIRSHSLDVRIWKRHDEKKS